MSKTTNVFTRVEPDIKAQAETVLRELGMPMSAAINLFLRQIILQHGIPFEIKLPRSTPIALGTLTEDELHRELEKGYNDIEEGRIRKVSDVFTDFKMDYDL
jgi:addiction module RelB/DinJ family antitoxin